MAVVRWTHPFVFDRTTLKSSTAIDAFEQAQKPLVILSDCTALEISSSKGSHVANLSATLNDNDVNYLSAMFPDDWLMAWILPNETRAKSLLKKLQSGKQCNEFADGFKFFGRVQTVFKDVSVDDEGRPNSIYTMTGVGFSEFDYTLFWEPRLVANDSLPVWYHRLGIALNNIITGSDKSVTQDNDPNAIDVNKMIPALVRLTLGEGPFQNGQLAAPGVGNASPNGGVRVPSLVGNLLGFVDTDTLNYSDIVDIVVGVQKFRGAAGAPQDSPLIFQPDGLSDTGVKLAAPDKNFVETAQGTPTTAEYQKTSIPLLGEFPMVQLPFQDTPIWQILEQFLNPAVNEMYVTLKPDEFGDVFPRLTVRQYPFNTRKFETYNALAGAPAVTTFLELPRWRIDPKMLKRIQVGRSNVMRANFWHIQGTGPGTAIDTSLQYVRSPPLTDKNDIERSGLRPIKRTVNCLIKDAKQGPDLWRNIIADITAGQQLSLTGTLVTAGIVSPIAPGDNVQFANVVYHVESLQHTCSISRKGVRDWKTILQLSHGMADETTLTQNQQDTSLDTPLQEYAGVRNVDKATLDFGRTVLDSKLGSE
jgi:hypothetical protein